ncbi:hypothetical protein M427DRAFT_115068 [Gonapodya prolifera JEL478]|uniref:Phytanoyl-CoA dioxygenase n=1 Tax=Gonapodya prolifera (strain JEL478) TaxID=1344416 RepID=A0A139A373_GONPJ|nr:hypothetical protein M427DRAFT_115068 [Gonapodya prolifera JEL478]|eukprot:KXS11257.1 hypothetical protein M427DRAFT_115068 [Gonapodya prolifera JEL478]
MGSRRTLPAVRSLDELHLVREDLKRDGFAGVAAVESPQELERLRARFFDWIEGLGTGADRRDPTTWTDVGAGRLGVIHGHGISHSQFVWDVRQNENVYRVFSYLWGTGNLLVSFDGACFSEHVQPPEHFPHKWLIFPSWAHVDQPPTEKGLVTIQGLLTLYDSEEEDGGLVVWRRSHKRVTGIEWAHRLVFRTVGGEIRKPAAPALMMGNTTHFYDDSLSFLRGCRRVKTCGRAGTLFLWDSRTVHCNTAPLASRKRAEPIPRAVAYVCMTPKAHATREQVERKRRAFEDMEGHGHDPRGLSYFPRSRSRENTPRPDVGQLGLRLAGVEAYEDEADLSKAGRL